MDCVINPYRVVDLASPVPGVLDAVNFAKSDYIDEGEVAATLEAGVERASVVLAKARAAIDSEVQVGEVNLQFDQRRQERVEALYGKKSVSVDARDNAQRQQALSQWRLQQAQDLKDIRLLELKRAEAQLAQKTIRTPLAGFVLQRFREAGEYVEDQPILRIAQLDPLYVDAKVPVEHRARLAAGMAARVYPDINRDEYVEAEVSVVDRLGDATTDTFGVRLTLPNPDYAVMAGVRCMVRFDTAGDANAGAKGTASAQLAHR